MPDPSTYRPAVGSIPESPGVYRFRDPNGRVIYVGKAKSLRQRLNSYFADVAGLHPRTRQMVTTASISPALAFRKTVSEGHGPSSAICPWASRSTTPTRRRG